MATASPIGYGDYTAEQTDIDRRRKYAEALTQQSLQPLETQSAGGWAIPTSWTQILGKGAQAYAGESAQKRASAEQRALGQKYQSELADTLMRATTAGTGSPERPAMQDPQEVQQQADQGSPAAPNIPAVAPDKMAMARILMGHPGTAPLGMAQLGKDMDMQSRQAMLASILRGGGAPGAAGAAGAAGAPSGGAGGAFAGMRPDVIALSTSGDPELAALGKMLEARDLEGRKPVINRGFGVGTMTGPGGTYLPDPASSTQAATTAGAVAEAKARADMGYNMQQMKVPVLLPGGDQREVTMNATQAHQYQTTGQLPPEIAAGLGLQQPAPAAPAAAPPLLPPPAQPTPGAAAAPVSRGTVPGATVPPGSGQMAPNRGGDRVRIMEDELAVQQTMPATPERTANIANLQREIQSAKGQPSPVVGMGQSQSENVTQQRQQAGGKATDEIFAKDYAAFVQGGASDAAKQIAQLKDVTQKLQTPGARLTGPLIGSTPDFVQKFTNPQSIAMRERVEEVVQRSLRAILGAQFTEKEGERLIARAYNPNQPEAENAQRVGRLQTQLEQAFQAKQDAAKYFERNGTLQGWQGKIPTISDFNPEAAGATRGWTPASGGAAAPSPQAIADEMRRRGLIK